MGVDPDEDELFLLSKDSGQSIRQTDGEGCTRETLRTPKAWITAEAM